MRQRIDRRPGRQFTRQLILTLVLPGLCLAGGSAFADSNRAGRWEGTIALIGTDSFTENGSNQSSLKVDSTVGFAFGIDYNVNSRFAIGFDAAFLEPDYSATFNTDQAGLVTVDNKLSVFSGQFNAVWNILPGRFTPYLEAGIGWTYVDSNVADGPPVTGCWWDPWWGYICQDFYSTYEETQLSYGGGGGVRYEFNDQLFMKASYNRYEIDSDGDGAKPKFDMWRVEFGMMF